MQRPADVRTVATARLVKGECGIQVSPSVDGGLSRLDALQTGSHYCFRGDLPNRNTTRESGNADNV
jgi:hypothetical protein